LNKLILLLAILMLTACSSLHHKNTWKQRHLSYTDAPNNCNATIPIVVHWSAGWHASLVIPNRDLKVSQYFKQFPFLEINWGDKGFYQAGANKIQQKIAAPKALLIPSESVMYFVGIPEHKTQWCQLYDSTINLTDTDKFLSKNTQNNSITQCLKIERDYGDLFQYYDAYQIWVTENDFSALTKKINKSMHYSSSGNPIDLGNGYLFDPAYSTVGRFFASDINYFGIIYTCNSWSAEVLGKIKTLNAINNRHIYRSEAIFNFLEQETKQGNSCIRKYQ
jgi:hypothetical protein